MLSTIGRQFRQPSGLLGRLISSLMKKGNMPHYDALFNVMNVKKEDKVFEIGYGPGKGIEALLEKVDCYMEGIDFSSLMHKEANRRNMRYVLSGKVDLYLGDFLRYKLTEGCYDKIFCINVVYFWDDLISPFQKIRQGLKEGGEFHFYMASPAMLDKIPFTKDHIFCKYTLEEVMKCASKADFSNVSYIDTNGFLVKCVK